MSRRLRRLPLRARLDSDLSQQVTDLGRAVVDHRRDPQAALGGVSAQGRLDLLLRADGTVLAGVPAPALLPVAHLERATREAVRDDRGNLWSPKGRHHARPSADAGPAAAPCTHPTAGTSVSILPAARSTADAR